MFAVRLNAPLPLAKLIRETLYQQMACEMYSLSQESDLSKQSIRDYRILEKLAALSIIEILRNAIIRNSPGIPLTDSTIIITKKNCPFEYRGFFSGLEKLKAVMAAFNNEKFIGLRKTIFEEKNPRQSQILHAICHMAKLVIRLQSFKYSINEVQKYCDEIIIGKGFQPKVPTIESQKDISLQLIRDSFYPEILMQMLTAIQEGWVTEDNISSQDGFIFWAFPALVVAEALEQSKHLIGAIQLKDNKVVSMQNCPDDLRKFMEATLKIKPSFDTLNFLQRTYLRLKIVQNRKIPEFLVEFIHSNAAKSDSLKLCINTITGIAIGISQKGMFNEMIGDILEKCSEIVEQGDLVSESKEEQKEEQQRPRYVEMLQQLLQQAIAKAPSLEDSQHDDSSPKFSGH